MIKHAKITHDAKANIRLFCIQRGLLVKIKIEFLFRTGTLLLFVGIIICQSWSQCNFTREVRGRSHLLVTPGRVICVYIMK